ncbi:hypothetical protein H7F30_07315 [Dermacoccus sp. PAMC28757]|uniref:hypothetical protein n=1 Tax=Dermacoccus sp. PAMC28757 TaxID=2762331 RepID=UPI00164E9844|nr:hypothetical protein [Dermacoccus sp. PAMC28757]QNK54050.1 hypothetical protein H7F30_07315 [Dermacoccus sp. PAMC28757]
MPCLNGIGDSDTRERIDAFVTSAPPALDPLAMVGERVSLDEGVVVFAAAVVTTNARLGRHAHIGRGSSVAHDCVLADYVSVMPLVSISGSVRVGKRSFNGTGASIRQGVTIGSDATIGMGAVVLDDVPDGAVVVGNPARPLPRVRPEPSDAEPR